jgi:hypothetical protein
MLTGKGPCARLGRHGAVGEILHGVQALDEWTTFAWQGTLFEVPEDWTLGAAQGDKGSGYLRLDDEELVRLELKWEKEKGTPDLKGVVKKYLDGIRKAASKGGVGFWAKRDMRLGRLGEREHEYFAWRAEMLGYGLVFRCAECKKVVFARVLGRRGEGMEQVARQVFSSVVDHQEGDEELWRFYDFEFKAPKDFKLEKSLLRAGLFQMIFSRGKDELEFLRQGLADYVLKEEKPMEWFLSFESKQLRAFELGEAKEGREVMGHATRKVEGKTKLLRRILPAFTKRREVRCVVWKCVEEDKVLGVRAVTGKGDEGICERAAQSVVCHVEG